VKTTPLPGEDGSVPTKDVLYVLRSVSPGLQLSLKIAGNEVTIVKDGVPEVFILCEDRVPRRMLHRFDKKYGFNIEFFYHPEMCCPTNGTQN
jgi:hypothetical protein